MSELTDEAPVLVTERLEMWLPRAGDLPGLVTLHADPETRQHLAEGLETSSAQFERLLRAAGGWALYGYGMFVMRPHRSDEIVGIGGVFHSYRGFGRGMDDVAEAGWILRADHTGHGYASEAMIAALHWFDAEHGHQRIACMIEAGNAGSERLAARLGFTPYGRQREDDGADLVLYERV